MYLSFLFCFKVFLLVVNQFFILSLLQDILIFSMDILDKFTVFILSTIPPFRILYTIEIILLCGILF